MKQSIICKARVLLKQTILIRAASVWMTERIGIKKAEHRKKNESKWKCRIEGDIKRLRQEVNRKYKGELALKRKTKQKNAN